MRFLFFILVVLVNVLVLPLVLLCPPLGRFIQNKLLPALGLEKKGAYSPPSAEPAPSPHPARAQPVARADASRLSPQVLLHAPRAVAAHLRRRGRGGATLPSTHLPLLGETLSLPAGLLFVAFGYIFVALGVTALVAGPYRPHTVAAKFACLQRDSNSQSPGPARDLLIRRLTVRISLQTPSSGASTGRAFTCSTSPSSCSGSPSRATSRSPSTSPSCRARRRGPALRCAAELAPHPRLAFHRRRRSAATATTLATGSPSCPTRRGSSTRRARGCGCGSRSRGWWRR